MIPFYRCCRTISDDIADDLFQLELGAARIVEDHYRGSTFRDSYFKPSEKSTERFKNKSTKPRSRSVSPDKISDSKEIQMVDSQCEECQESEHPSQATASCDDNKPCDSGCDITVKHTDTSQHSYGT